MEIYEGNRPLYNRYFKERIEYDTLKSPKAVFKWWGIIFILGALICAIVASVFISNLSESNLLKEDGRIVSIEHLEEEKQTILTTDGTNTYFISDDECDPKRAKEALELNITYTFFYSSMYKEHKKKAITRICQGDTIVFDFHAWQVKNDLNMLYLAFGFIVISIFSFMGYGLMKKQSKYAKLPVLPLLMARQYKVNMVTKKNSVPKKKKTYFFVILYFVFALATTIIGAVLIYQFVPEFKGTKQEGLNEGLCALYSLVSFVSLTTIGCFLAVPPYRKKNVKYFVKNYREYLEKNQEDKVSVHFRDEGLEFETFKFQDDEEQEEEKRPFHILIFISSLLSSIVRSSIPAISTFLAKRRLMVLLLSFISLQPSIKKSRSTMFKSRILITCLTILKKKSRNMSPIEDS